MTSLDDDVWEFFAEGKGSFGKFMAGTSREFQADYERAFLDNQDDTVVPSHVRREYFHLFPRFSQIENVTEEMKSEMDQWKAWQEASIEWQSQMAAFTSRRRKAKSPPPEFPEPPSRRRPIYFTTLDDLEELDRARFMAEAKGFWQRHAKSYPVRGPRAETALGQLMKQLEIDSWQYLHQGLDQWYSHRFRRPIAKE